MATCGYFSTATDTAQLWVVRCARQGGCRARAAHRTARWL